MAAVFALIVVPIVALVGAFVRMAVNDHTTLGILAAAMVIGLGIGIIVGVLRSVRQAEEEPA